MQVFFQRLFWWVARCVLRLRYRVDVLGGDRLRELQGPTIVMPNHPGYVDPALVLSHLRLHDPLRPLVYSGTYRNPVLYPVMRALGSVEVPELSAQSRQAKQTTLDMIGKVTAAVKRGESILIYPSGRLQREGFEVVGASRAAAELLRACPEANVVLVRTRGVWGSMFSWGQTASQPHLGSCMVRGLLWGLANLVFFLPRRHVTMTIEVIPRDRLPDASREQLNPFLEQWYNRDGRETPTFVRYHFLSTRRDFEFPRLQHQLDVDFDKIRPATRQAVDEMVEEHLRRPLADDERTALTTLDQLGLDSLDRMDLALEIEQRFGFRSDRVAATLGELWALAEGLLTGDGNVAQAVPPLWTRPHTGGDQATCLAGTMAEALIRRVRANPDDVAVADRLSGALTYRRTLVGASLMSKRFARFEGRAVGVLLPSSVAADLVFFALHLAGKLPVMLNWTTGPAHLSHAVQTMNIRHVVTSRRFVDRLGVEIEEADYTFLEDLRAGIGRLEAAMTLARTYLSLGSFLRGVPQADEDDPAVVLFTSGSEAAPKAVPLSHANLLADIQAGIEALGFTRQDVLLGFLPPFHSFGLAGNLVCPVLTGIRVAHHADPTDARGLVQTISQYNVSLLFTTPTFLGYMLARATSEDFRTLRIVVTGAEKCPEVVRETCARLAPQAAVLEGYGITECSPVVSVGRPGKDRVGTVGQPLAGVEACVVDPETHQPLPIGHTGLLLVAGPTIFHGYLHYAGPDPFIELDGRRWYNTGDLAALDEEQFIHFRGRLKRFLKAGGEMISLPALEEPLTRRYPPTEEGPQVAVEGIETPDGRRIVLFSTQPITLKEANAVLAQAGLRGVMRLDDTRQIDNIPVLGTGKTDYKVLRKLIAET
jgi:acyl-CoA synthetase (AMP-forming)/AMP-acid ligase II/1-acyl-sn-glycerol-3-phosphate acyltransferase/acyl carrier protein